MDQWAEVEVYGEPLFCAGPAQNDVHGQGGC